MAPGLVVTSTLLIPLLVDLFIILGSWSSSESAIEPDLVRTTESIPCFSGLGGGLLLCSSFSSHEVNEA